MEDLVGQGRGLVGAGLVGPGGGGVGVLVVGRQAEWVGRWAGMGWLQSTFIQLKGRIKRLSKGRSQVGVE